MDFRIVDIFAQDGQLVVKAEHFHPDPIGAPWFTEHYTFQGREGLKRKRATTSLGNLLLDDGTVAPTAVVSDPLPRNVPFLPPGRTWQLRLGPHMDDSSILSVISSTHQQRLATGWPQGKVDSLSTFKHTLEDDAGCPVLLARFQALTGRVV